MARTGKVSEADKNEAMDLLLNKGWTYRAVADKFGVNASLVGYWKRTFKVKKPPAARVATRVAAREIPINYHRAVKVGITLAAMKTALERIMKHLAEDEVFTEEYVADLVAAMDASLTNLRAPK